MTPRTLRLVERRAREVRLPADEVAFLLDRARHVVDVVPTFRRGLFRLTARNHVGWFDSPVRRIDIRPKVPWPTVGMLLGLNHPAGEAAEPDDGLLGVLAREFADRLREVIRVGLVPGYRVHDTTAPFLTGKLRAIDQLRDAAARAFPDRFHVTESVLDLDTPWNRIPRAVADMLLANPDLPPAARAEVRDAAGYLDCVSTTTVTEADFAEAAAEPRVSHYGRLLDLCRTLHDGFAAARGEGSEIGGFLIDLSRAFEQYLTHALATQLAGRRGWAIESHPHFPVGPVVLKPDILLRRSRRVRAVLDAKWKTPTAAPDTADLHQILAYATVTGARRVGLVYPGRRFGLRNFAVPGWDGRVSLIRLRVVGTGEECAGSVARLARFVRHGIGGTRV